MTRVLGAVVVIAALSTGVSGASVPSTLNLLGDVHSGAQPIDSALVVSFGLSSYQTTRTFTDGAGNFRFPPLPAGVYRVIAVKSGFAPAVATVVPSDRSLALKLKLRKGEASAETRDQIWEIRRSLPSDILREIDIALGLGQVEPEPDGGFEGAMTSLASFDSSGAASSLAHTSVALRGALPAGWRVDISGRHVESDGYVQQPGSAGQQMVSSGLQMSLSTDGQSVVRLGSTRNQMTQTASGAPDAGIQSHHIAWSHGGSEVAVRYLEQQNALPLQQSGGLLEVRGGTTLWDSERTDLGVGVRFIQETSSQPLGGVEPARLADITTTAVQRFGGEMLELHYGLSARVGADAENSWSPESRAVLRLSPRMSLLISGQVKVGETEDPWLLWPAIVRFDEIGSSVAAPRYRYGLGVITGEGEKAEFSGVLTVTAIDDPVTIIFDDLASDVWDAYVLETGDRHQELALRYRTSFAGDRVAVDVHSTLARTAGLNPDDRDRGFLQSRVRSLYLPSGTSVDIAYRRLTGAEQSSEHPSVFDLSGERLNLRMGQSLHLPLDLTLLVGVDLSRDLEGPGDESAAPLRHRYVGGVALAF